MDGLHDPEEPGSVLRRCPCPKRGIGHEWNACQRGQSYAVVALTDVRNTVALIREGPWIREGFPATPPSLGDHQRCTARLWNVHRKRRTRRDYEGLHGFDGDSGLLSGTRPRENMERPRRSVRLR
jgi:hypothetical protein